MMSTDQNKPSVSAMFMDLDEAPCQQQRVYRQQRVFSENYLQKSTSIGSREKRSSNSRRNSKQRKIKKNSTNNDSFDGMQGLKSTYVGSQTSGIEERNDLAAKNLVLRPNLGNVKGVSKPLFLLDSHTTFGWEFKKLLLERSKRAKVSQEIWSRKRVCNRGDMPSEVVLVPKQRSELGTRIAIGSNDGWKEKSVTKLPIFKRFNVSSTSNTKFKRISESDLRSSTGRNNKNVSTIFENAEISTSLNVSYEKGLPSKEGFKSLNCIEIDDDFPRSTGEAYQPSPNSVLEPDNSSSSEYGESISTDLHGLWMKLQILKSEAEENQCDKSEIVALSEEEATENSFSIDQSATHVRCFGLKESQQFSYLVDLLNELGFQGGNVEVNLEQFKMNPKIFETLEKKYAKQESWNKDERRLLFDCINLGLTEIVRSKPLRRKMSTTLRRAIVEEEVWKILLSQQEEVNADLSEKAVGKDAWLELGDEMDYIVVEIEDFLFNELAAELFAI